MMRATLTAAAALTVALAACGRSAPPPPPLAPTPEPAVVVVPLAPISAAARITDYNDGGIRDSVQYVIRDADRWAETWTQVMSTQTTPQPLPSVDFEQDMVLLAAAGRMTANDDIVVDSAGVRQEPVQGGGVREYFAVHYVIIKGCGPFTRPAFPLNVVRVRRYPGEVRFTGRLEDRTPCP